MGDFNVSLDLIAMARMAANSQCALVQAGSPICVTGSANTNSDVLLASRDLAKGIKESKADMESWVSPRCPIQFVFYTKLCSLRSSSVRPPLLSPKAFPHGPVNNRAGWATTAAKVLLLKVDMWEMRRHAIPQRIDACYHQWACIAEAEVAPRIGAHTKFGFGGGDHVQLGSPISRPGNIRNGNVAWNRIEHLSSPSFSTMPGSVRSCLRNPNRSMTAARETTGELCRWLAGQFRDAVLVHEAFQRATEYLTSAACDTLQAFEMGRQRHITTTLSRLSHKSGLTAESSWRGQVLRAAVRDGEIGRALRCMVVPVWATAGQKRRKDGCHQERSAAMGACCAYRTACLSQRQARMRASVKWLIRNRFSGLPRWPTRCMLHQHRP